MRVLAGFAVIWLFLAVAFGSLALLGVAGGTLVAPLLRGRRASTRGERLAVGALGGLVLGWATAVVAFATSGFARSLGEVPLAYLCWVAALVGGAAARALSGRRA